MSPRPANRWRLPALVALVAAAVLILAGVGMSIYEDYLYTQHQARAVSEQASVLAASLPAALEFGDKDTVREYIAALEVNPELEAVGVYGRHGTLVAQFSRGAPLPEQLSAAPAKDYLNAISPVIHNRDRIGSVYLRADPESLSRRLSRYALIVLLLTLGALVVAVLGVSQGALTRANAALELRAFDLSELNRRLQTEMEEHGKTEEALRQSHKMEAIGQLSGGVAHDFNNLLMIIKGNLQLLRRRMAKGESGLERYIDSADEGLERAASLTRRLLAFARRQPLAPLSVNLSELVAGMSELIRHSAGERVATTTHLEAQWWTLCDANQMENVILNLAINARDAMPEGGRLLIETRDVTDASAPSDAEGFMPGDYVELVVRDSGQGMSDEVRRRAIDPFFTTKPLGQGTGLGLSMTFGYVRQSGGTLSIESAPGVGTRIVILMPRYVEGAGEERKS
ncbi:MAG TPA: ATP-binding protein [Rhizomicrobium sp.]|jgi:signal transduction histidine kinase